MKKTTTLLILIITLSSYSQITKQTTFNQKSENYLNKSSDALHQKDSIEKLIPISEFEDSIRDADFFNPKQSKNTTLYSKANNENTIRLDSLSTVDFNNDGISGKTKRSYNENGYRTHQISYNWDADSAAFIPNGKTEYAFDENGRQTLQISYNWDADSAAFIPNSKSELTYDENGYRTHQISYNWDADSAAFIPNSKYEFTYDENGYRTHEIYYNNWNADSAALIPSYKYEYAYDENGRQTLQISYNWDADSAALIPHQKTEYAYDENGRQTLQIRYNWDSDSAAFILNSKYEFTYDENNFQIGKTEFDYNSDVGVFVPKINYEYGFDDQMRVISEEGFAIDICNNEKELIQKIGYKYLDGYEGRTTLMYNIENGQAVFRYEIGSYYQDGRLALQVQIVNSDVFDPNIYNFTQEYTYNENGNQTLFIINSYDEQTDSLIPDYKKESSYDVDYNLQEVVYSNWYAGLGVYKPSIKKEYSIVLDTDTKRIREGLLSIYNTDFNQWNTLTDEKYHSYWYYTKSSTLSSESINKDTNVVFPNPTSKFLKVNLSDSILNPFIEIFDVTGKKVFSKKIKSDKSIDVSILAPAIYVYKIKDGSTIKKSGKIIKE